LEAKNVKQNIMLNKKIPLRLPAGCIGILALLLCGFIMGFWVFPTNCFAFLYDDCEQIFALSLPYYEAVTGDVSFLDTNQAARYLTISGIYLNKEYEYENVVFPAAKVDPPPNDTTPGISLEEEETEPSTNLDMTQPIVAIYCTHNAEAYTPTEGAARMEGKNAGIFNVATELYNQLLTLGIPAVLCDTIHDYPEYNKAYTNSLASIQALKEEYPSLEVFIDVHRDSPVEGVSTTVATGTGEENLAKLMLVVGSDKRYTHPLWQQNHAFSQAIGKSLESICPGILRGVRVQDGRYNQQFSTKCILVEVGSSANTLDEALTAADILAKAVAENL
jgi:stage II sporulation protein P